MKYILNAGHGALQEGKRSPTIVKGVQFMEYEFNRDIVRRIALKLHDLNIPYEVLMPNPNIGAALFERVTKANNIAEKSDVPCIYVSVHANANGNGIDWDSASGIETWYFKNSSNGLKLASLFQDNLMKQLGDDFKDRGIRAKDNVDKSFYELRKTNMYAVLTENGFYTNRDEVEKLYDDSIRQKIADGHVEAIKYIEANGFDNVSTYHKNVLL